MKNVKQFLRKNVFIITLAAVIIIGIAGIAGLIALSHQSVKSSNGLINPQTENSNNLPINGVVTSGDTTLPVQSSPKNSSQISNPTTPTSAQPAQSLPVSSNPTSPTNGSGTTNTTPCTESDTEKEALTPISRQLGQDQANITETDQKVSEDPNNQQLITLLNQQDAQYSSDLAQFNAIKAQYGC